MYGTLAFMRTLPGRRAELVKALTLGRGYRGNYVPPVHGSVSGWISTFVYELDKDLKPQKPRYYLGDPEAAEKAAQAVAAQIKK